MLVCDFAVSGSHHQKCSQATGPARDIAAPQAGQKRRNSAPRLLQVPSLILFLLLTGSSADILTTIQPVSLDVQSAAQQSSSAAADALHAVSLVDNLWKHMLQVLTMLVRLRLQIQHLLWACGAGGWDTMLWYPILKD